PVRQGLVPWASPDPRAIFPLQPRKPWPRTVQRAFKPDFRVTFDHAFGQVMRACGERPSEGTWITADILSTYDELHDLGWAHSVEVWDEDRLAGGLYGIAMGALFAGESMFHRETGASKVAFASCAERCGHTEPGWPVLRSFKRLLDAPHADVEVQLAGKSYALADLLARFLAWVREEIAFHSNAGLRKGEPIEVAVSVPANASTAQR